MVCERRVRPFLLVAMVVILALAGCGDTISADEHFENGNRYVQAKDYDKAIAEFEAALKKDPKYVSALSNLGVVYYQLGRYDEAVAQYQKSLELAPKDADIYSNYAAALVQTGQLDRGLEEYRKALNFNSELAEAHFGLGVVLMQLGRTDEAIQAFKRFRDLDTGKDPVASDYAKQYLQQLTGQ